MSPEALLFELSSLDSATVTAKEMLFILNEKLAKQDSGARLYAGLTDRPVALYVMEPLWTQYMLPFTERRLIQRSY